ncbi:hypothetical protein M6D81_26750 [Paenibacillus sp. J5C_2022]|uniref:S16 family serine protease n=1 Tax=Paenibacillus sp. J5C2022 TaxID=2977129 RepID=UPI0021D20D87|nr:S16 family serine protease [Paenibacillus sp. J5C2022]MCU6712305.1 hypothetical protein [Paenibacillus sp. J5C2022]
MRGRRSVLRRVLVSAACTAALMWALLYAPTPYVVYEPGIAIPVASMMERDGVEAEASEEEGLLLTAVKLTAPNMWEVAKAGVHRDKEVAWKRDVFRGDSQRQFAQRLTVIMQGSQNDALEAAYRHLGVDYGLEPQALVVSDVLRIAGQVASGFRAGDVITGVNEGEGISGADSAVAALRQHNGKDDSLSLNVTGTDGKHRVVRVRLPESGISALTADQLPVVLGVTGFIELRAIVAKEPSRQLNITANGIGGPSAGLVFALQGINLLTDGELADGMRIAATGTIAPDGKVGAIGGVRQKVVSTSRQGAELFLVPKGNERDARRKSEAIGSEMKIVGVSTLEEALGAIADYRRATVR